MFNDAGCGHVQLSVHVSVDQCPIASPGFTRAHSWGREGGPAEPCFLGGPRPTKVEASPLTRGALQGRRPPARPRAASARPGVGPGGSSSLGA